MENKEHKYTPLGEKFNQADFSLEPAAWPAMEKLLEERSRKRILFFILAFGLAAVSGGLLFLRTARTAADSAATNSGQETVPTEKSRANAVHDAGQTDAKQGTASEIMPVRQPEKEENAIADAVKYSQRPVSTPGFREAAPGLSILPSKNAPSKPSVKNKLAEPGGGRRLFILEPLRFRQPGAPEVRKTVDEKNALTSALPNPAGPGFSAGSQTASAATTFAAVGSPETARHISRRILTETAPLQPLSAPSVAYATPYSGGSLIEVPEAAFFIAPVRSLWSGPRQEISLGAGSDFRSRPSFINKYRADYAWRVTPLLSIGGSLNYSWDNISVYPFFNCLTCNTADPNASRTDKNYIFSAELEANLYFIHSRTFDFFVTAGYGRRWAGLTYYDYSAPADPKIQYRDNGFSFGLNFERRIRSGWFLNARAETRRIRISANPSFAPAHASIYDDQGLMLLIGKNF